MGIKFSGKALATARKRQGWTPEHLSAECWRLHEKRISGATIRNYERGHGQPSIPRASLLAETLGLEIGELCQWHEPKKARRGSNETRND